MLDDVINAISSQFGNVQQALFEALVQPLVYALGMGNLLEDAYTATGWLLVGLLQLLIMVLVFGALERWRPVEALSDRPAVRTDVFYTLIHRLGLFRVALFFLVEPWVDEAFGWARVQGFNGIHLDELTATWWPGISDTAWFSLVLYLLVFDFVDYWIHRGQHASNRWWSLHAVHHSQRQMTMWSDNRNHLLDDMLRDLIIVLVARGVGVPPGQFVAVVAFTQLVESLSHANTRVAFGSVLEKVLVGPRFHRVHHGIGIGHESSGPGSLGGCNFAVLFPVWDILFGTADFRSRVSPTGIRDQLPEMGERDYGRSFLAQQWLGVLRLIGQR
jgi:sterol desaturase/sphingolipid hydroxylase (fatty acid hydroxylase superfamily)